MPNKFVRKIILAFMLLTSFYSFVETVVACQCYSRTVCQAYTQAKSVFIGKLEKVEEANDTPTPELTGYFSVEKTYKGTTDKLEKVKFRFCFGQPDFKVGERYFVYREDAETNHYCNRTHIFQKDGPDVKYAESLSADNPIFTIGGFIEQNLSQDELRKTEVWIEEGQNKYQVPLKDDASFNYSTSKKAAYRVRMILPFNAEIWLLSSYNGIGIGYVDGAGFNVISAEERTIIEYDLNFSPNACDFRSVNFGRVKNRQP